ncbi:MAG: hypothetical protein ABR507_05400 [Actinomycetota bacterium]
MTFRSTHEGKAVDVEIGAEAIAFDGLSIPYVDIDQVHTEGHSVTLITPSKKVTLSALGAGMDRFVEELRTARMPVRRAAMLQWTGNKTVDQYRGFIDEQPVQVSLFSEGLTIEGDTGEPRFLPLSCIKEVDRNGYQITFHCRAMADLTVSKFGTRTDELIQDIEKARTELSRATTLAYTELDASLAELTAPDGWAVSSVEAGASWDPLRDVFAKQARAEELDTLTKICGGRLRLGLKIGFEGKTMPFALAPHGGRVAVESADEQARATFIFSTDDVDRLNLVLLLTNFKREAIYLAPEELGRWAVAVRNLEVVRWAREHLAARIVHDEAWSAKLADALST